MRINQFVAAASGLSRRAADQAITAGRVTVNGAPATVGQVVPDNQHITLDGAILKLPAEKLTILLNKPVGYVCSRAGQGSQTIYDLLPSEYQNLKPVGRLDKDSSGLLLLTNDGKLAQQLTHPKFAKEKVYEVSLDKPLTPEDRLNIQRGVELEDGLSSLQVAYSGQRAAHRRVTERYPLNAKRLIVRMHEGRNRQIRRSFAALGYDVKKLNRIRFGNFKLGGLQVGNWQIL